jgi:hypothetical protein
MLVKASAIIFDKMQIQSNRCGWLSDLSTLCDTDKEIIILSLERFIGERNPLQLIAWNNSIPILQQEAGIVLDREEIAKFFNTLLEYELPREGGRRPDVVILQTGVIVVEFKDKNAALPADLDQVAAYARDLKHYHEMSHELEVTAVLIPTLYKGSRTKINSVYVLPPNQLSQFLVEQARLKPGIPINALNWANGEYAPLPSLVQAARLLFQHQPLPRIKRAEGAKLPEVVDLVLAVCHEAAATKTRHLIFVTGVPGSGKTLVGLQVAHSNRLDDLRVSRANKKSGSPAVFLSGNGPLVEVLQDALDSKAFVAGMKKFIDYYRFKRFDLSGAEKS